jgi:glycine cleavage system regulatory protein
MSMNTSIVLTVIADDQPGIVQMVSEVLTQHGGNWTQSSMSALAGKFAGILLASVPSANSDACVADLRALESKGLRVMAHVSDAEAKAEKSIQYRLDLVGNDHVGIVHDITTLLANHKISVNELETSVESASMGGGDIFRARAILDIPQSTDLDTLEAELEDIAHDLMVDIRFT